ncbi:MAG: IS3 family transposase [Hungatella sp.]|jgi:putative transposase|nr:IS3 family transposase [Hungatella sp.]
MCPLKRELIQDTRYETPKYAQNDIFKYIELYYNTKRIYSALGYITSAHGSCHLKLWEYKMDHLNIQTED